MEATLTSSLGVRSGGNIKEEEDSVINKSTTAMAAVASGGNNNDNPVDKVQKENKSEDGSNHHLAVAAAADSAGKEASSATVAVKVKAEAVDPPSTVGSSGNAGGEYCAELELSCIVLMALSWPRVDSIVCFFDLTDLMYFSLYRFSLSLSLQ